MGQQGDISINQAVALSETLVPEVPSASVAGVAAPGECATRSNSCSSTDTRRLCFSGRACLLPA